jgi:hypothetical protein
VPIVDASSFLVMLLRPPFTVCISDMPFQA